MYQSPPQETRGALLQNLSNQHDSSFKLLATRFLEKKLLLTKITDTLYQCCNRIFSRQLHDWAGLKSFTHSSELSEQVVCCSSKE